MLTYQSTRLHREFLRYVFFGILTNVGGFLLYLFITSLGVAPKVAVTGLYLCAATASYFGHRQWAFQYKGGHPRAVVRYALAHLGGYLLNLSLIMFFVDHRHFPHEWVQAAAVPIVAVFLFLGFRYWAFPAESREA